MATLAERIDALAAAIRTKINAIRPAYKVGDGGTVAQTTSKTTAVTLNKLTGEITIMASGLAAGTIAVFTFNNSTLALSDMLLLTHQSGGTFGAYLLSGRVTANGVASIAVRNTTAALLSESVVIKFAVVKAVIS